MKMEVVAEAYFLNLPKSHIKIEKLMSYGYIGSLCMTPYNCMRICSYLKIFLISKYYLKIKINQITKQKPHKQHLQ